MYVDTSHVRDGALGELKEAIAELAEFVQENEPQSISYGVVFSEDCDLMTVVHVHPDPSSLDHHLDVAGPASRGSPGYSACHRSRYGELSDKALQQLRDRVRSLVSGEVVVHAPHAGFSRSVTGARRVEL